MHALLSGALLDLPDVHALLGGGVDASASDKKVYLDWLLVSALDVTISFLPAPWVSHPGPSTCTWSLARTVTHARRTASAKQHLPYVQG